MFIINPGTEVQQNTTEENAVATANQIVKDFDGKIQFCRQPDNDDERGWFGFLFTREDKEVTVDIPGVEPERVTRGEPFYSPRLYVGGSSWLYGYALNSIERKLFDDSEG